MKVDGCGVAEASRWTRGCGCLSGRLSVAWTRGTILMRVHFLTTTLINEKCNLGNWIEELRLYGEIHEKGIQPNSCIHSLLVKQLAKTTNVMQLVVRRMMCSAQGGPKGGPVGAMAPL